MAEKGKTPKRLSRRTIYQCPWVNLHVDRVLLPSGKIIEQYHVVEFDRPAVGVIVENGENEILFVQVCRYPTDSLNWEIPAGRMEKDESPEVAAAREVLEESGYRTSGHNVIYTFNPINGISNETFHIVACIGEEKIADFDPDEVSGIKWLPKDEIVAMIRRNEIRDGFSLAAMLLYLNPELWKS
jgi:ADP-ribose pyrophosphatase